MFRNASSARLTAGVAAAALLLTACGSGDGDNGDNGDGGDAAESYSIGVTQFLNHPALDASAAGFKEAFDEAGVDVEWDEQNAQGEQETASNIAGTFASGDYDLIHAIATPTAQAAAQQITEDPVVFSAITDPEDAGLVDLWMSPAATSPAHRT